MMMESLAKLLLLTLLTPCLLIPAQARPSISIPYKTKQLVLVVSNDWDSSTGQMFYFKRKSGSHSWQAVEKNIAVNLGRAGMAWGQSSLMSSAKPSRLGEPSKREGDGRSPAGIFPILEAFGFPSPPHGYQESNLPFKFIDREQCVDDPQSKYYNEVIDPNEVGGVSWSSAENMRIDLYRMGLVIGHNCPKAQKGLGSCIFFHIQSGQAKPTLGCTSTDKASLAKLLLWLKASDQPLVMQLPRSLYKELASPEWPEL